MTTALQFDLVTPEQHAFSGEVDMVEVPGEMGDFGVLPGHAPFLSQIRPGIVSIHMGGTVRKLFITAGYAEVNPMGCTVLAEKSEDIANLSVQDVQARCDAAQAVLDVSSDKAERAHQQRLLTQATILKDVLQS